MNDLDLSVVMLQTALRMRALGEWMMVNQEKLSPGAVAFFNAYMLAVARYAGITMEITHNPQCADRRAIFY